MNIGALWLLTEFLGVYYMLSNLFGIAAATLWNYGMNANLTWGLIRDKDKAQGKEAVDDRELPKISIGEPPEQTIGWRLEGLTLSGQKLFPVAASLWLQLMVIIFIVVEISRLKTPVADWVNNAIRLISME